MRETRSSGPVEGVVSNHDPYSDSGRRGFKGACIDRVQRHPIRRERRQNLLTDCSDSRHFLAAGWLMAER